MNTSNETKTYKGNCHCGAYKFHVALPELKEALACNCSMCFRKGYMLVEPKPGPCVVERGEGSLSRYVFGDKMWAHDFCAKCGTTCYIRNLRDDEQAIKEGINVNCLNGLDVKQLKTSATIDGKSRGGPFQPQPPIEAPQIENKEGWKTYNGQCHCGKVQYSLKADLENEDIVVDNCSICSRNAYVMAYIPYDRINFKGLDEETTIYNGVGSGKAKHRFCTTCSVPVCIDTRGTILPEEVKKSMPADILAKIQNCPINLRLIEGFEELLKEGKVTVKNANMGTEGYVVA